MLDRPNDKDPGVPPREPDGAAGNGESGDLRARMLREAPVLTAYRLNYVANRFTQTLYAAMEREHGIGRAPFVVMLCLATVGEATAQEIADATHRPKNSLSRAVRELEAKGLVERDTDPNDARRQPIRLTAAGRQLYERLLPMAEEAEQRMLDPIEDGEREALLRALGRMVR